MHTRYIVYCILYFLDLSIPLRLLTPCMKGDMHCLCPTPGIDPNPPASSDIASMIRGERTGKNKLHPAVVC